MSKEEWKKADRMFRYKWWSPRFIIRHYRTKRFVSEEAQRIVNSLPKPRVRP